VDRTGIGMNTLVTRSMLAKLLLTDPRTRALQNLDPIAYLLTGRGKLPLFSVENLNELPQERK
jgi:hypothetical protein